MSKMRPLTTFEANNCQYLKSKRIDFVILQITVTGINKEIFDSTREIRAYLLKNGIHDYSVQPQESTTLSHKKECPSFFIVSSGKNKLIKLPTSTVFYRPQTKKGDPRMNVYRIHSFTTPFDKYAIIATKDKELYYINISNIDVSRHAIDPVYNPIRELVDTYPYTKYAVAMLLYNRLFALKGKWIPSVSGNANNAVGYAIEAALGIPRNASNNPDFMGIEIKSHRTSSSRKGDLFSLAPNWCLSNFKSSKQIATCYGQYDSSVGHHYLETTFQINTISPCRLTYVFVQKASPARSFVELIEAQMTATGPKRVTEVAKWCLMDLHDHLLLKHPQTFWIAADSRKNPTTHQEEFMIKEIEYTTDPNITTFDSLLNSGGINIDVSVYRRSGNGDTYKFKVKAAYKGQLMTVKNRWTF